MKTIAKLALAAVTAGGLAVAAAAPAEAAHFSVGIGVPGGYYGPGYYGGYGPGYYGYGGGCYDGYGNYICGPAYYGYGGPYVGFGWGGGYGHYGHGGYGHGGYGRGGYGHGGGGFHHH